uniref:Uncharacterized protein n=1 Tax=Myotis myotis TaxID=51298 RepID=A0A7J7ZXG4_MYOMY|nr:hypothetical protein mMyoMyo1_009754 [Myotis myotis]
MGAGHGRSWQSRELGVPCLGLKQSPRSRGAAAVRPRCPGRTPRPEALGLGRGGVGDRGATAAAGPSCRCGSQLPGPDASVRGIRPGQGQSLQPRGAGGPLPRPDTSAGGLRPGQGADPVIGDRRVMRVNSSGRGIRPGREAEPAIRGGWGSPAQA